MSNFHLSIHFFLQLAVILSACRLVGLACRRVGQPQVVGEMVAGVLLGPSLLGVVAPQGQAWLFPQTLTVGGEPVLVAGRPMVHPLMTVIYCAAQVGLSLYMFLVGVEFRGDLVRRRAGSAVAVSAAGIVTPFALGGVLAWAMVATPLREAAPMFTERVSPGEAVLYLGAAMSITAFPMLARIIDERGLAGTALGALALAAGSIDDAAAWCLLAVVLASFTGDATIAALAIGGGVGYAAVVLGVLRPALRPLARRVEAAGALSAPLFAGVLVMVMIAAWITDAIGIYAVFGAFILGAAMPRGRFAEEVRRRIEPLTTNLLLPMFFVYSGLNTRIGLLDSGLLWAMALLVLLAACAGKGVACGLAARWHGEPARQAVAIGALMNSRGLMELIILNIGYERGVITQTLFSMMVIMAIVTTIAATPIFELACGREGSARRRGGVGEGMPA